MMNHACTLALSEQAALESELHSTHPRILHMRAADGRDVEQPRDACVFDSKQDAVGLDPPDEAPHHGAHLQNTPYH